MANDIFPSDQVYEFIKVEQYFERYKEWDRLGKATGASFDQAKKAFIVNI